MAAHVAGLRWRGVEATAIDLPKKKAEEALPAFRAIVPDGPGIAVGGQSYGGGVARPAAAPPDTQYEGLILFSYPLHAPGQHAARDDRTAPPEPQLTRSQAPARPADRHRSAPHAPSRQEGAPLPVSAGRRRAVFVTAVVTCLVVALLPTAAVAKEPPGLNRFMNAVGKVESNGRYNARNSRTGAIGKYQVMPSNWPAWAKKYLGDAKAKPTSQNQERVARGKFIDLWNWLDSWPPVAHWWLTGLGRRNAPKCPARPVSYVAT